MTKYWGGKTKIGKPVANAMLDVLEDAEASTGFCPRFYWEPFLGMAGVMRHMVPALTDKLGENAVEFIGTDNNQGLIDFWQFIQSGRRFPDHWREEHLQHLKDTRAEASAEHIFVGHSCGYHGQYFSGRIKQPQADAMLQSANRSIEKIRSNMSAVRTQHADFFQTEPPHGGGIIYCDPPYVERVQKSNTVWNSFKNQVFDCDAFWRQVTQWSRNNLVFVSETAAPPDWEVVWTREWSNNQGPYSYQRQEFLFVHHSWLDPLRSHSQH
jgi:site-specific DNA-adenine methylase